MGSWIVKRGGRGRLQVQAYHGKPGDLNQYVAFHTESGYLRMVPSTDCRWGSSVMVLPSFWSEGAYIQGSRCTADWNINGDDAVIFVQTKIAGLAVSVDIKLHSPTPDRLWASVAVKLSGEIGLDERLGEAFRPVVVSSMHVSPIAFDTLSAFFGQKICSFEPDNWIIAPTESIRTRTFGLIGGSCAWKQNSPTIAIHFDRSVAVAGWTTQADNPNSDNISVWASAPRLLNEWNYSIIATPVYPKHDASDSSGDWWT